MNWKRYKLLIIAGAICLVLSGGFVFWLVRARGQLQTAQHEVQRLQNDQTRLAGGDVFPSEESFTQLQSDLSAMETRREAFREAIVEGQSTPPAMSRARFGDYVRTAFIPVLHEAAAAATRGGDRGVQLRDPSFGQQRYIAGDLPEPGTVTTLMLELDLMRHLSLKMFEAGISELIELSAEVVTETPTRRPGMRPAGAPTGAPTGAPSGGSPFATQPRPGTAAAAQPQTPEISPVAARQAELFEKTTFHVRVRVYEDFFWELLNMFAADDNQIVVHNLRITTDNEGLWPPYLQAPAGRTSGRQAGRPTARTPRPSARDDIAARLAAAEEGAPTSRTTEQAVPTIGLAERREKRTGGDLLDVAFDITVYRLKPVQGS